MTKSQSARARKNNVVLACLPMLAKTISVLPLKMVSWESFSINNSHSPVFESLNIQVALAGKDFRHLSKAASVFSRFLKKILVLINYSSPFILYISTL